MRRIHISLALALLLLLAQQGAVLHEISHIIQLQGVEGARAQSESHAGKICELCVAFSQVANPAGHSVANTSFEPASCSATTDWSCAATPAFIPTPRSRGPPSATLNS
jgi:hypothetical protein